MRKIANGPHNQHNAIVMVMMKAIALSNGGTIATPMSLLAASAGSDEKMLPTPNTAPPNTTVAAPIVFTLTSFDSFFFMRERALA